MFDSISRMLIIDGPLVISCICILTQVYADACEIKITNFKNDDKFNHKVIIFNGFIENENKTSIRELGVENLDSKDYEAKIDTKWPINSFNEFKGLIRLEKGNNRIVFSYKTDNDNAKCSLEMSVSYEEYLNVEPLHLVIVAGRDSKLVYDVEPGDVNDFNSTVAKYRVMAWLWQAFTDDQIYKQGFGHRSFRLDETELIEGEYYPKVHLIRSSFTTAQIRLESTDLYSMCKKAVLSSSLGQRKPANKPLQFTCLLMDSHKIPNKDLVVAAAAVGSGWNSDYNFGVFGSHLFYSHPASLKEIKAKFSLMRRINTNFTSNDSGDYWASVNNVGIGAFLHEVGHSLGLYHSYGIMYRGFEEFNKAIFSVELDERNEFVSLKTGQDDLYATFSKEDCIIMSVHHLLRQNNDEITHDSNKIVQFFTTSKTRITLYAAAALRMIAFHYDSKYYYTQSYSKISTRASIEIGNSFALMNLKASKAQVSLVVVLQNGALVKYNDIFKRIDSANLSFKKYKSQAFGRTFGKQMNFSVDFFPSSVKSISHIKVFHGAYVHGLDFIYLDETITSVGFKIGSSTLVSLLNTQIRVLRVKSGAWLDSIQFCFSNTNCTQFMGGTGGDLSEFNLNVLTNSRGYRVSGFSGAFIEQYSSDWTVNAISLIEVIYKRM